MPDMLVRNVPNETVRQIEKNAARLGLSREEYLRRELARISGTDSSPVTREDLTRAAAVFADVEDPAVMEQAWS